MDPDLFLTAGVFLTILMVPSLFSAMSDGRAPRASALTILIAGAAILFAATEKPGGYQVDQIPGIVLRTVDSLLP
ncbi:MAG: hypothetical protein AB3N13_08340 [Arenibacterium sp.]